MKIAESINMNSVYSGLDTVRGYMPSADMVKSWTIEPIKSAWSKPTGKAAFIAVGVLATLAIGVKLISLMKSKSEVQQPKPTPDQLSLLYLDYKKLMSKYSLEKLESWLEGCQNSTAELNSDQNTMVSVVKDLIDEKRTSNVDGLHKTCEIQWGKLMIELFEDSGIESLKSAFDEIKGRSVGAVKVIQLTLESMIKIKLNTQKEYENFDLNDLEEEKTKLENKRYVSEVRNIILKTIEDMTQTLVQKKTRGHFVILKLFEFGDS